MIYWGKSRELESLVWESELKINEEMLNEIQYFLFSGNNLNFDDINDKALELQIVREGAEEFLRIVGYSLEVEKMLYRVKEYERVLRIKEWRLKIKEGIIIPKNGYLEIARIYLDSLLKEEIAIDDVPADIKVIVYTILNQDLGDGSLEELVNKAILRVKNRDINIKKRRIRLVN